MPRPAMTAAGPNYNLQSCFFIFRISFWQIQSGWIGTRAQGGRVLRSVLSLVKITLAKFNLSHLPNLPSQHYCWSFEDTNLYFSWSIFSIICFCWRPTENQWDVLCDMWRLPSIRYLAAIIWRQAVKLLWLFTCIFKTLKSVSQKTYWYIKLFLKLSEANGQTIPHHLYIFLL